MRSDIAMKCEIYLADLRSNLQLVGINEVRSEIQLIVR
jgi:hypothetical protein